MRCEASQSREGASHDPGQHASTSDYEAHQRGWLSKQHCGIRWHSAITPSLFGEPAATTTYLSLSYEATQLGLGCRDSVFHGPLALGLTLRAYLVSRVGFEPTSSALKVRRSGR